MEPGTLVDGYEIVKELGHGGFADVYEVIKDGFHYALKVLRIHGPLDQVDQELAIHSSLPPHPHVEQFYKHWAEGTRVHFLFELCDGGTLNDYVIRRRGRLSTQAKVALLLDAARGLAHLHDNNIVHRDIKPDNILLVNSPHRPTAKIADLGISRVCPPGVDRRSSRANLKSFYLTSSCGSLAFEAPEVVKQHYNERCDVYSLGLVFYSVLAETVDTDDIGRLKLVPTIRAFPLPNFCYAYDPTVTDKVTEAVADPTLRSIVIRMLKHNYHFRITSRQVVEELENYFQSCDITSDMFPQE